MTSFSKLLALVVALLVVAVCPAAAGASLQYFGYYSWDPAQQNVNLTVLPQGPAPPGVSSYILLLPFDVGRPETLTTAAVQEWFRLAAPDPDRVVAVWVTDEPELAIPLAAFDASVAQLRAALPNVRLWTNFSTELRVRYPSYQLPVELDWVSVDNNGDTPLGAGLLAFKQIVWPHQRLLMLPPGEKGLTYGDEASMVNEAFRVYQYAAADPSVVGLVVWDWFDRVGAVGVRNLPQLRDAYARIGAAIVQGVVAPVAFGSNGLGNVPLGWTATVGDFNGDGKADILWRNTTTGAVAIWFMSGGAVVSVVSLGTVPVGWTVAAVADFNGDGKADILWRDSAGNVAMWVSQ